MIKINDSVAHSSNKIHLEMEFVELIFEGIAPQGGYSIQKKKRYGKIVLPLLAPKCST